MFTSHAPAGRIRRRPRPSLAPLLLLAFVSPADLLVSGAADPYSTLGVPRTASASDIKKAYRKAALRHHPDKVPESDRAKAEERFKEVAKAYETLGDENKRELYDRYGERSMDPNFQPGTFDGGGPVGGGGGGPTFHFGNGGFPSGGMGGMGGMFGGMPQRGPSGSSMGEFAGVDLNEIIRQMMGGAPVGADPRRSAPGGGFGTPFGGRPHHGTRQQQRRSKPYKKPVYCSLEDLSTGCTKRLKVSYPASGEKIYNIQIKPGWKEGTTISYPSSRSVHPESGAEVEFPPMTFVVREKEHSFLRRSGDDLIWECRLTKRQAERGAKLKLPLPDGTTLEVESREGTASGEKRRVRGRGMPIKGSGFHHKGDVLIEFIVVND